VQSRRLLYNPFPAQKKQGPPTTRSVKKEGPLKSKVR